MTVLRRWTGEEWEEVGLTTDSIPAAEKGAPLGVATLDADGVLEASQSDTIGQGYLPLEATLTTQTVAVVDVLADGLLYGIEGTIIKRSADNGTTWTTVQDLGSGSMTSLRDVGDGEVIRQSGSKLYRSSGWDTNQATATWTLVYSPTVGTSILQWGLATYDNLVLVTEYAVAPRDPAKITALSTNYGATFATVHNLSDYLGAQPASQAHPHAVEIDHFHDGVNPRLWLSTGDIEPDVRGVFYSDNLGASWTKLTTAHQPTTLTATEHGIVCGSDTQPDGVFVIARDDLSITRLHRIRRATSAAPAAFAYRAWRGPDDVVYVGFTTTVDDEYGYIIASNGHGAEEVWRSSGTVLGGHGVRNLTVTDTAVIAQVRSPGGGTDTLVAPLVQRGARTLEILDPGLSLGGVSSDRRSVAVGTGATAAGIGAVAVGMAASAPAQEDVAVGWKSVTSGTTATAVGAQASATGPDSTALGAVASAAIRGTALGKGATTTNNNSVAVGLGSSASLQATALGYAAEATADDTVAVGHAADALLADGTAVGKSAVAGLQGTSVGWTATSGTTAVAVGRQATATSTQGTAVGAASSAGQDAVAVGWTAAAATAGVAIGPAASTVGANSVSVGRNAASAGSDSVAVGDGASAPANNGVAIGDTALSALDSVSVGLGATSTTRGTALGMNAATTNNNSVALGRSSSAALTATAVGYAAQATGTDSTALGEGATASAADSLALGEATVAAHSNGVALGAGVSTTTTSQVAIGARHLELTELAADPAAPAANGARWFTKDNGAGKTQLCVRFATGAVVVIATEP